jgi:hypothetical protein
MLLDVRYALEPLAKVEVNCIAAVDVEASNAKV